jgi:hypothetical protein
MLNLLTVRIPDAPCPLPVLATPGPPGGAALAVFLLEKTGSRLLLLGRSRSSEFSVPEVLFPVVDFMNHDVIGLDQLLHLFRHELWREYLFPGVVSRVRQYCS